MDFLLVLVVLAVVAVVVAWPLYRAARPSHGRPARGRGARGRQGLQAPGDPRAKLDYRTGKLSEEDWRAQDARLRAEAADLLRDLDRAKGKEG